MMVVRSNQLPALDDLLDALTQRENDRFTGYQALMKLSFSMPAKHLLSNHRKSLFLVK